MKLFTLFTFISITLSSFLYAQDTHTLENHSLVKAGDKFITLLGKQIHVGDIAPNFKVVDDTFTPVTLHDFKGKNVLISVVPSLDTGVCSIQTKKFNKAVEKLPENTVLLTISNDLPFAQKRFCQQEKVDNISVLSDAVWRDFGMQYGLLIKDMGLLTRAIFLINAKQQVVYKELVENLSNHPNYDEALEQVALLNLELSNKE